MECGVCMSARPNLLWKLWKHSQSDLDILITFWNSFYVLSVFIRVD